MTEDPLQPPGTLIRGRTLVLGTLAFIFLFGGAAIWLSSLRVRTKPAIDTCNTIGVHIERTAGEGIAGCRGQPVPEPSPERFTPVSEPGFSVEGVRSGFACEENQLRFGYRFTVPCDGMDREVQFRVNLPPKDVNAVREDLRLGVVEACQAVLEMNCDCRKDRGVPPGVYATTCGNIDADRQRVRPAH